jgi:hypothetical protein
MTAKTRLRVPGPTSRAPERRGATPQENSKRRRAAMSRGALSIQCGARAMRAARTKGWGRTVASDVWPGCFAENRPEVVVQNQTARVDMAAASRPYQQPRQACQARGENTTRVGASATDREQWGVADEDAKAPQREKTFSCRRDRLRWPSNAPPMYGRRIRARAHRTPTRPCELRDVGHEQMSPLQQACACRTNMRGPPSLDLS